MNQIAVQTNLFPSSQEWGQMTQIAAALLKSGFLPNSIRTPEAAVAIMLTGREMGVPPMRAFSKISVINGKPALGAELLLARVYERYPNADIEVVRRDAEGTTIRARRSPKHKYAEFSFLLEDARRAECLGKDSWKKWPKAMYYWRAVSDMVRSVWPEVLGPASHTPEELGAEVNEDGEVIEAVTISNEQQLEPPPPAEEPPHGAPVADDPEPRLAPKRTAKVYDHQDIEAHKLIEEALGKTDTPKHMWAEIGERLHGKPSTALRTIIPQVKADYASGKLK